MGVKSTVSLSREQAEAKYIDLIMRAQEAELRSVLKALVSRMSNQSLEDKLEELNDADKGGEGFENYDITQPASVWGK